MKLKVVTNNALVSRAFTASEEHDPVPEGYVVSVQANSKCELRDGSDDVAVELDSTGPKDPADAWFNFPPCTSLTIDGSGIYTAVVGAEEIKLTRTLL